MDTGFTEARFFESMPKYDRIVTKGTYYLLAKMRKVMDG